MKTANNNRHGRLAQGFQELCKATRPRIRLILLIALAISATCSTSFAQSIIGSPGAGFQTWKAANLNNNGAPYWDAFTQNQLGNKTSRNIGFCLTNSGDCVGINSALFAPGAIPFWGMPYNSAADTGGGQDTLVYFKRDHEHLRATLQLQLSTIHTTNSAGLRLIQRAQRSDPSINSSKGPEFRPEVWCHPQSEKKSASSPPSILASTLRT